MKPVSLPTPRPQPDAVQYGVQELQLFPVFTRQSFAEKFGQEPPVFDPNRKAKTWFDSSMEGLDPEEMVTYRVVGDRGGQPVLRQIAMTRQEAATVNLPGDYRYPAYEISPTRATRGGVVINPEYLSEEATARSILAAAGRGVLVDEGDTPQFAVVYPAGETRRMWAIVIDGQSQNAGVLWKERCARGVGSPGRWELDGAWLRWEPALPAAAEVRGVWEVPVRDLLPNEALQAGRFAPVVVRTDVQRQLDEASGRFTPQDRALLREAVERLRALKVA